MEHSIETLAYAAGLMDGEGNIVITVRCPTKHSIIKNPSYELIIALKITDLSVIEWMQSMFGGYIYNASKEPSRIGYRPAWTWRISGKGAKEFLNLIYPHLKIKQQQARLAIEFETYHYAHRRNRWTTEQQTQEITEQCEIFRHQLNSLHLARKEWNTFNMFQIEPDNMSTEHSVESLAYAAGFFDGEGCVYIQVRRPTGKYGKNQLRCSSYRIHAQVANTCQFIIVWLQSLLGGTIQDRSTVPSRTAKQRPVWVWSISSDAAQQTLELLEPFLKIKQQQARLGIEFQRYNRQPSYRNTEREERNESYYQRISNLNQPQRD